MCRFFSIISVNISVVMILWSKHSCSILRILELFFFFFFFTFLLGIVMKSFRSLWVMSRIHFAKTVITFLDLCLTKWKTYKICGKFIKLLSSLFFFFPFSLLYLQNKVVNKGGGLGWGPCVCQQSYLLFPASLWVIILLHFHWFSYTKSSSTYA